MFWISFIIIAVLVGIDQLTKYIAVCNLDLYKQVEFIPHILNFRLTYNTGAAWSILSDHHWILVVISLVASAVLIVICFKNNFIDKRKRFYSIAISLITAGTVGNLIDRVFVSEGVVDFLELGFMDFPIFNVADSLLTVGVILLGIYIIFIHKDEEHEQVKTDIIEDENHEE